MDRRQDIARLTDTITTHHMGLVEARGLSGDVPYKEFLDGQELIDWIAITSAEVEYMQPTEEEDPEKLAQTYHHKLDAYVERWVYPKAEPQYFPARRLPWWRRIQVVWYNMGSFSLPWLRLKK